VRTIPLTILPLRQQWQRSSLSSLPLHSIQAEEESLPPEATPVCWLSITTLPVTTLAEACQCILWYRHRWVVERYHVVLKSGCRLDELQLEDADRIQRDLAT